MTVHRILRMGEPRLFQVASPVTDFATAELNRLVSDMFETMRAAGGCGLAAPQIGISARLLVFGLERSSARPDCTPLPDTVLINPEIEVLGAEFGSDWEGCLSVPGLRGRVRRPEHIGYRAYDGEGRRIEREVKGFQARVIQHECDHLNGVLYPSRIEDWTSFGFVDALQSAVDSEADAEDPSAKSGAL